MTFLTYCYLAAVALCLIACAPTPKPQLPLSQLNASTATCNAGGDARGIAAGFFALFQDAPECF